MIAKTRSAKARPRDDSYHVLLTPQWEPCGGRQALPGVGQRVARNRAWVIDSVGGQIGVRDPVTYNCPAELSALLGLSQPRRKGLTVWLPRGWEDFVGSGLANVVDQGDYRYRWACLDGPRVLFAGMLGKRPVNITSLPAWTGGAWDAWRDQAWELVAQSTVVRDPTEGMDEADPAADDLLCALGSVVMVLAGCRVLDLGKPKLSIGAQARAWWAGWGGPKVAVARPAKAPGRAVRPRPATTLTVPLPQRPAAARGHEGHCCHGLAREQYYRGHVGGPVHVLDMASAYLAGLVGTTLPAVYCSSARDVSVAGLRHAMCEGTGCALVRLEATEHPYPVYRHDEPHRAVGSYWAWLAGAELVRALDGGVIAECRVAHFWHGVRCLPKQQLRLLHVAEELDRSGHGMLRPFWRGIYSACVGGWAQRRWAWEDVNQPSQVGRWATWTMAGATPDQLERWRVVAGRVQRRVYRGEAPHACPLAYACVTAAVRVQLDALRGMLPAGTVLATACDALWLTQQGVEAVQNLQDHHKLSRTLWRVKDTYDDAWLDGQGGAVVLKGGMRYPLLPGVPHGVCLSDDGKARWERASPWTDGIEGGAGEPRRRRVATWDGSALMARNSGPLAPATPWLELRDTRLPESLLAPYDPARVRRRRKTDRPD